MKKKRKPRHIVIITGNRSWEDDPQGTYAVALLLTGLRGWHEGRIHLYHGACPKGADQMAANEAMVDRQFEQNKIKEHRFPVDWNEARRTLGTGWKSAGHTRNKVMILAALSQFEPEKGDTIECIAFTDNIREQSGTKQAATFARNKGIPTLVVGRYRKSDA